jgi:DNA-binding transcriptional LysR family regulator
VNIALSKLEREFEWPLFDGSKRRGYRLTEVGEVLYHYAKRMLRLRSGLYSGRLSKPEAGLFADGV